MRVISVIVPLYYGEKYIPDIIHQIEECKMFLKNDNDFELIFVNDAPNMPISPRWNTDSAAIIIINTEKNVGIHGARLKGLLKSHGEYVLFLDQDDKIEPKYFYSQLRALGENDAVVCRAIEGKKSYYSSQDIFKRMVCKEFIVGERNPIVSPGQVLLRQHSIPDIWMKNVLKYNGADDWFLWLCMIAEERSITLNQEILYEHVWRGTNASSDLLSMRQSEQEVISIIQKEKIFSDEDFTTLLNGFFKMNTIRMKELDILHRHDNLLENWLYLRNLKSDFSLFFKNHNYNTIAIYGAGKLGKNVFYELLNKNVEVVYAIDQNSEDIVYPVTVYSPKQLLPHVDAVVITVIDQYENISKMLSEKIDSTMIPLEKIIEELIAYEQKGIEGNDKRDNK